MTIKEYLGVFFYISASHHIRLITTSKKVDHESTRYQSRNSWLDMGWWHRIASTCFLVMFENIILTGKWRLTWLTLKQIETSSAPRGNLFGPAIVSSHLPCNSKPLTFSSHAQLAHRAYSLVATFFHLTRLSGLHFFSPFECVCVDLQTLSHCPHWSCKCLQMPFGAGVKKMSPQQCQQFVLVLFIIWVK